jgi:hypothetical protein
MKCFKCFGVGGVGGTEEVEGGGGLVIPNVRISVALFTESCRCACLSMWSTNMHQFAFSDTHSKKAA